MVDQRETVQRCKCGVAACKGAKVRDIPKGLNLGLDLNTEPET